MNLGTHMRARAHTNLLTPRLAKCIPHAISPLLKLLISWISSLWIVLSLNCHSSWTSLSNPQPFTNEWGTKQTKQSTSFSCSFTSLVKRRGENSICICADHKQTSVRSNEAFRDWRKVREKGEGEREDWRYRMELSQAQQCQFTSSRLLWGCQYCCHTDDIEKQVNVRVENSTPPTGTCYMGLLTNH